MFFFFKQKTAYEIIPPQNPEDLANNLYEQVLGRAPDPDGMAFWTNELKSGNRTVADVVDAFFLGDEYTARQISNEEFVRGLYAAILGREADDEGLAYWVQCLEESNTRRGLLHVFVQQSEFADMCGKLGLQQGSIEPQQPAENNHNLTRFVHRMYAKALGRNPEMDGLNHWCGRLLDDTINLQQLAENFLLGDEFNAQGNRDESFIRTLYLTFMDREADAGGLAFWKSQLENGGQRRDVLAFFASSSEFKQVSAEFGLAA